MGKDHKYVRVALICKHRLAEISDTGRFVGHLVVVDAGEGGGAEVGDVVYGVDDEESLEIVAGWVLERGSGVEPRNFNI